MNFFPQVTRTLVSRAEAAGFSALVLTVDAPYFGRRLADVRNRFQLPPHLRMANFVGLGEAEKGVNKVGHLLMFADMGGGGGVAQRKHSCYPPSRNGFESHLC